MHWVIQTRDLSKTYGGVAALQSLKRSCCALPWTIPRPSSLNLVGANTTSRKSLFN